MHLPDKDRLREQFEQYPDDQLMEILKNRKDYQEQAVDVAVDIALERKLINSRQDLFAEEFNQSLSSPRRVFPMLNAQQTAKMTASLFRIVYLVTLLPFIFALMSYAEGNLPRLLLWGITASGWLAVSWIGDKKRKSVFVFPLVIIFIGSHIIYFTSVRSKFSVMDFVLYGLIFLLFFYLMSYLYVLLRRSE